jgi:hypothetical protein
VGIRTGILGMAAMLGVSGDYIGTLDGSAWYQRGWMIAVALVLFGAHVGVELLNTREDRRLARALDDARDRLEEAEEDLNRLHAQRDELSRSVAALRAESEINKARLKRTAQESDGLAWLVSDRGRAALDGLRDFADHLAVAHGTDDSRAQVLRRRGQHRDAAASAPLRRVVPRVALQLAAGLLAALAFGAVVYGIEVYLD